MLDLELFAWLCPECAKISLTREEAEKHKYKCLNNVVNKKSGV